MFAKTKINTNKDLEIGWMSLTPGTGSVGFGCFVPDLTRLSKPPCGEAHPIPF